MNGRDFMVAGLREQIELDRRAMTREWEREHPDLNVILSLARHIAFCEARL